MNSHGGKGNCMRKCIISVEEAMTPPTKPNGVKNNGSERGVLEETNDIPVLNTKINAVVKE